MRTGVPVEEEKAAMLPPVPSQLDTANTKPVSKGEPEATDAGDSRRADGLPSPAGEGQKKASTKSSPYRGVTLFKPTMKWRAQISAGGKTTSLGDHDTEEEAARAFDRAAINKAGAGARTNFDIDDYKDEIVDLQAMQQSELVAMLRSWARKSGTQTSHYRGVSLLKQTQKWHAQINVGGKQVHLGFFPSEEQAARAYDRAAINKGARDGGKIITNFDISDYQHELDRLRRIGQHELVEALASETRRRQTMELLASGSFAAGEQIFGSGFDSRPEPLGVCSVAEVVAKAERAQPKPTQANPLYANFGKKRQGENGERLPLVTRPPHFPPPAATPARRPGRPRALFRRRKRPADSEGSSSEGSDGEEAVYESMEGEGTRPARRSARNAGRVAKHYSEQGSSDEEREAGSKGEGHQAAPLTPQQSSPTTEWAAASPPFRRRAKARARVTGKAESEEEEEGPRCEGGRRKEEPAPLEPAEGPTWELLAHAVAAVHGGEAPATPQPQAASAAGTSAAMVPTPDALPRLHSAATAGSRATADAPDPRFPRPPTTDRASIVRTRRATGDEPPADTGLGEAGPAGRSVTPVEAEQGTPSVAQAGVAAGGGSVEQMLRAGSLGEKGSVAMRPQRDKASTLAGFGAPAGDKLSDAARPLLAWENSSVERTSLAADAGAAPASEVPVTPGKKVPPRKGAKRKELKEAPAGAEGKPAFGGKPLTKRQKAMLERRLGQPGAKESLEAEEDLSPKPSQAAAVQPSPRASVAGNQEDAASQSSPQAQLQAAKARHLPTKTLVSSSDDSHGPKAAVPVKQFDVASSEEPADSPIRREGPNRRKRKQPARAAI